VAGTRQWAVGVAFNNVGVWVWPLTMWVCASGPVPHPECMSLPDYWNGEWMFEGLGGKSIKSQFTNKARVYIYGYN